MIRFEAGGTRFTLPLLTLIMPLLAIRLGLSGSVAAVLPAFIVHELAHLLAARRARVTIREIRITPFGGSARMENPYLLRPLQLFCVAAAGPAANLASAVLLSALAQWRVLSPSAALKLSRPQLVLMLFNLLPALPLDGGRMLCALLSRRLGARRVLQLGCACGILLSASLLALACAGWLRAGRLNLTLLLASVFLLASVRDEYAAMAESGLQTLRELLSAPPAPQPVRFYQLDMNSSVRAVLRLIRPREGAWFILLRDGQPESMLDGRSLLQILLDSHAAEGTLGELPCYLLPERRLPPQSANIQFSQCTRCFTPGRPRG